MRRKARGIISEHDQAIARWGDGGWRGSGFMSFVRVLLDMTHEETRARDLVVLPDAWQWDQSGQILWALEIVDTHNLSQSKRDRYSKLWFDLDGEEVSLYYGLTDVRTGASRPVWMSPMPRWYDMLSADYGRGPTGWDPTLIPGQGPDAPWLNKEGAVDHPPHD